MFIVGLGNPGTEYEGTRHNVGSEVLDKLLAKFPETSWKKEFGVLWCRLGPHWLIKPQQYMNLSGQSLKSFLDYKHLDLNDPAQLLVVHDDVDFPLGESHEQLNRSAGGHNGVQSIIDTLGTQNFNRLRIGIGNNREVNVPAEEYVLQKFSGDEKKIIASAVSQAVTLLRSKIQE